MSLSVFEPVTMRLTGSAFKHRFTPYFDAAAWQQQLRSSRERVSQDSHFGSQFPRA
jgi:hypothetical protein